MRNWRSAADCGAFPITYESSEPAKVGQAQSALGHEEQPLFFVVGGDGAGKRGPRPSGGLLFWGPVGRPSLAPTRYAFLAGEATQDLHTE